MSECWCCDRGAPVSPRTIFNRPALSALTYRVGTFSSFRRAMIETIATEPLLLRWTSRDADDYGIEIVELWAYLADVLTFYQERIANEAFLRTTTQRDSLTRLAALIDYSLRPGVAATAYLAFTLDKSKQVQLPARLRVQSKPAPGQQPATFETEATLNAKATINQLRVLPVPTANLDNFGANSDHAIVLVNGSDLKAGQSLVLFAGNYLEEKKIVDVTTTERGQQISWSPPIRTAYPDGAQAYRLGRKFKLFGYNAPATYMQLTFDDETPPNISGKQIRTDFSHQNDKILYLDGIVSDLNVNSQVLLVIQNDKLAGNYNGLFTITEVSQEGRTLEPLTGTVTRIELQSQTVSAAVPNIADIRTAQVYELTSGEISFSRRNFGGDPIRIPKHSFRVYSDQLQLTDLTVGGLAMIADDSGQAEQVTITKVTSFKAFLCESGIVIEFMPPLLNEYSGDSAVMYGNVVKATHGETIKDETLGSGDGAQASQSFALKKSPVTFTPDATAPRGALTSLRVSVDGVKWTEAPNFFGRGPNERIYATMIDESNVMRVQFGDGVRGARPPTGVNNIHALYRKGWGKAGSVDSGKLTTLLDAQPGLKSATNPAASFGWAEPETISEARRNAPTTVLTFDRAVSLRDFENLARAYPGVGKARAAWVWNDEQQVVRLSCAASDGKSIVPIRSNLLAYLDARRDPNRQLEIVDFKPVGIKLHAFIVPDPDYDQDVVLANVQVAAGSAQLSDERYGFFAFDRLDLDADIHLSELYAAMQSVAGVVAVEIDELHRKDDSSHTLQSIVPIGPSELAMIDHVNDLVIELKSAL